MENAPLTFIIIAVGITLAMLVISYLIRRTANRKMPGSHERGTHWIGQAGRRDDDFDGDGL